MLQLTFSERAQLGAFSALFEFCLGLFGKPIVLTGESSVCFAYERELWWQVFLIAITYFSIWRSFLNFASHFVHSEFGKYLIAVQVG